MWLVAVIIALALDTFSYWLGIKIRGIPGLPWFIRWLPGCGFVYFVYAYGSETINVWSSMGGE